MAVVMQNIGQYALVFLMLFYTYLSFSIHRTQEDRRLKNKYVWQMVLMSIMYFICYAILYYHHPDWQVALIGFMQYVFLLLFVILYGVFYPHASKSLTNNIAFLMAMGFVMIERLTPDKSLKQFCIAFVGAVFSMLLPLLLKKKQWIKKGCYAYAIVGLVMLVAVLVLGHTSYGANLSIAIGPISFQPSEFVKLLFVMFMASYMAVKIDGKHVIVSGLFGMAHVLVLVASNDLGSALIFFVVYTVMLYVSTGRIRYVFMGLAACVVAAVLAYMLFAHVRVRVQAWLDPWPIIDNKGYQITQSLFAIGTGGFFGMGLYKGLPTAIPVVEKDFMWAAISEELGLIFAICLILLCFNCFLSMMKSAATVRDRFYKLLAVGCATTYIFQCFLTIGGVTKFIPSTGVTLPFVSYGGSSVLMSLLLFAMVQTPFTMHDLQEHKEVGNGEAYAEEKA